MKKPNLKWKLAQQLEYKWWQNYLKRKKTDEYLKWKTDYWNRFLKEIEGYLPELKNKTILDAGCGPAGIFLELRDSEVFAVDPLLDKYKNLSHFNPDKVSWTKFKTQTIESLNEVEKFDLIFCLNAINHVRDVNECYDNLVRALKPGGVMIISTDAHKHQFVKRLFQFLPGDVLHPVQLDIAEYNKFLSNRGLKIRKNINYEKGKIFDYYVTISEK